MCKVGELYYANFPYEEDPSKKELRPIVIVAIHDDGCECATLMITSKNRTNSQYRYTIEHWKYAGLRSPSFICLDRKCSFFEDELCKKIGGLHPEDQLYLLHKIGEFYHDERSLF